MMPRFAKLYHAKLENGKSALLPRASVSSEAACTKLRSSWTTQIEGRVKVIGPSTRHGSHLGHN